MPPHLAVPADAVRMSYPAHFRVANFASLILTSCSTAMSTFALSNARAADCSPPLRPSRILYEAIDIHFGVFVLFVLLLPSPVSRPRRRRGSADDPLGGAVADRPR